MIKLIPILHYLFSKNNQYMFNALVFCILVTTHRYFNFSILFQKYLPTSGSIFEDFCKSTCQRLDQYFNGHLLHILTTLCVGVNLSASHSHHRRRRRRRHFFLSRLASLFPYDRRRRMTPTR